MIYFVFSCFSRGLGIEEVSVRDHMITKLLFDLFFFFFNRRCASQLAKGQRSGQTDCGCFGAGSLWDRKGQVWTSEMCVSVFYLHNITRKSQEHLWSTGPLRIVTTQM